MTDRGIVSLRAGVQIGLVFAALAATLAGCASASRPELTEAELEQRAAADMQAMGATIRTLSGKLMDRTAERMDASPDGQTTLNILAMSGGGDYGAFGAGFLVGWGEVEEEGWERPDFDVVTGVSTGALLAPFAFLGTDEALATVEEFYRNPKKDWIRQRGWLFFLPSNPSFMKIPGLERDLRSVINEDFVRDMGERSLGGRSLLVSATDLDLGRQKFWDLGEESELVLENGDPDRVQRMLMASAAIPAVFPPIAIDDGLYADGGVTANVLFRLDPVNPNGFLQRWLREHPDKPVPRVRYWIIINNQLQHVPRTVQPSWTSILGPSLEAAIRAGTLAEVARLAARADFVNEEYGTDIEIRVVGIPDDWRAPVKGDFQRETMISLSETGRDMGANPESWQVWAAPGGPRR